MSSPTVFDVVIVGSGLSGLMVAHEMQRIITADGGSWRLLEARPVLGGRLANDEVGNDIDLGGAWIWPSSQQHMNRLVQVLGIRTFLQPDDPSCSRMVGGAFEIIRRLADSLPQDHIQTNTAVVACRFVQTPGDGTEETNVEHRQPSVCLETSTNEQILARRVVFAVPPKLLSMHVKFDPPLSQEKQLAMAESDTWMVGVTKVALVYRSRFWKDEDGVTSNMGLRLNNSGPAFQVYDGSTHDERVAALTFFTLVNPDSPTAESDKALVDQCASEIQQVWSAMDLPELAAQAKSFTEYHIQRWPLEKYISEDSKPLRVNPHPSPIRALSLSEWDGALLFAGSETDTSSPGLMEGAAGAAVRVVRDLKAFLLSPY